MFVVTMAMSVVLVSGCSTTGGATNSTPRVPEAAPLFVEPDREAEPERDTERPVPYSNSQQPTSLNIPALDVQGRIQPVGMTDEVTMQVPSDIRVIGWFDRSVVPLAEQGNTVVVGHRDGVDDPEGVFRRLGELSLGDEITVENLSGRGIEYVVSDVRVLDRTAFAAQATKIFATDGPHRLVLMTCGGEYDSSQGGYQANVVVTAKRV